jgi:hypothetical protein
MERDLSLMTFLYNLRYATTNQIHDAHGYVGKFGKTVTRKRLKYLEDKGYLKSFQGSVYEPKTFYLSKKGSEEVSIYNGYRDVRVFTRTDKTPHQVMVTECYCILKKSLNLRRFVLNQPVAAKFADALIEIKLGERDYKLSFLEVDMATERIGIIIDKLVEYQKAYESNYWQHNYGVFPEVTFVTVSDTRKRSLLRLREKYQFKIKVLTFDELTVHPESIL